MTTLQLTSKQLGDKADQISAFIDAVKSHQRKVLVARLLVYVGVALFLNIVGHAVFDWFSSPDSALDNEALTSLGYGLGIGATAMAAYTFARVRPGVYQDIFDEILGTYVPVNREAYQQLRLAAKRGEVLELKPFADWTRQELEALESAEQLINGSLQKSSH